MPAGRYFQRLTTFDLLGNFVPGVVVLVAALVALPEPPLPSSPGGYALFGIAAFSLGHVVQEYASLAAGDRRSFVETIDAARQVGHPPVTDDEPADDSPGKLDGSESRREWLSGRATAGFVGLRRALLDPILWPWLEARGEALETVGLANQVWKHILTAYDVERGTDDRSQLYHLMASELDDVEGPSRALRFQAIRNFHRGMWIATWTFLALLVAALLTDAVVMEGTTVLGIVYERPAVHDYWQPIWQIAVGTAGGTAAFWYLAETYEEEFIEYLFTDYAVTNKDANLAGEAVDHGEERETGP